MVPEAQQEGIQKSGERCYKAKVKEMIQIFQRNCFKPIRHDSVAPSEKKRAKEELKLSAARMAAHRINVRIKQRSLRC